MNNKINKDVKESIQELEEEIREKQNQIDMLTQFSIVADKTMTEKQYHEYCKTQMRCTDSLGKSLVEIFPFLTYDKRGANGFYYKLGESQIRIPSYNCIGIDIIVELVFKSTEFVETNIYEIPKVKVCMDYIDAKNTKEKAHILYPSCRNTLIGVIRYLIMNTYKNYDKKMKSQLNDYIIGEKELQEQNRIKAERSQQLYLEQQDFFEKYVPLFLQWTNEVRVYARGWERPVVVFTLSDGKLVKTIKW